MGVKVKYKGQWVDPDEAAALRVQEQQAAAPPPPAPVDVAALPERADLDPDVPLTQLFYEHPEVRPYITAAGKMRSGLTAGEEEIARAILGRYGGQT